MRKTQPILIAGNQAARNTVPPPPWLKKREHQHLQKFKEFKLSEFAWVSGSYGQYGRDGAWIWGDGKEKAVDQLLREQQHEKPVMHRYVHPELPAEQDRIKVPHAAQAVIASHIRGRPGGYGLTPEQINIPLMVHSEKPELDTAKKDEPRTAMYRWGQYREVEVMVPVESLGLSPHARRRFEEAYHEYIHDGEVYIKCDNYEDFWDNYEFVCTKINLMVSDAKKADIHPKYRPMEQYKVRDTAYDHAVQSLSDWHARQHQSILLGEKYTKMKSSGAESVTGFNLYETPAYAVFNTERALRKKIMVNVEGVDQGYTVDKMSAALGTVRAQKIAEFDEEESIPEDLHDRTADGAGAETTVVAPKQATESESEDFRSELSSAFSDFKDPEAAPIKKKRKSSEQPQQQESVDDLFADFVNPDDE